MHFRPGAGPGIPSAYKAALYEAIKTIPATPPYFATCCEATQCDRVVLVPDVAAEKQYAGAWRELMLASGLRAVRSTPVHGSDGRILGCLALYFSEPRQPNPTDAKLVEMATHLAAIAIERDQTEQTRQLLLKELNHRVKNTLANVQAIAQRTVRSTNDPADFVAHFSGRIQSLARVHSLLTDSTWEGADLRELIRDQLLQGSVDEARLTAWGPAVHLEPQMATHLALMLHELGTNSSKYGALSAVKGWVAISWTVTGDTLNLQWVERGGPRVSVPTKRGFGTTLIEQSAKSEGGVAELVFEPEGIAWKIRMTIPHSGASEKERLQAELATAPAEQGELATMDPAVKFSGLRFLIIEDESLIALDLKDRLEEAGAAMALPVSTEQEALQAIADGANFDCALLDANLHGHPVNDIAAALTRRNVPFLFVTGYGAAGLPASFKHAPILSKPVSDDQLFDAVTRVTAKPDKVMRLKS